MKRIETASRALSPSKAYIAALVISFVLCWILLVLGAVLITYAGLPKELAWLVTLISVGISSFVGGFLCSKRIGSKGLIFGTLFGALLFLVIYIVGVACFDAETVWQNAATRLIVMLVCGAFGGVLGVNRKQSRRR